MLGRHDADLRSWPVSLGVRASVRSQIRSAGLRRLCGAPGPPRCACCLFTFAFFFLFLHPDAAESVWYCSCRGQRQKNRRGSPPSPPPPAGRMGKAPFRSHAPCYINNPCRPEYVASQRSCVCFVHFFRVCLLRQVAAPTPNLCVRVCSCTLHGSWGQASEHDPGGGGGGKGRLPI
jgi:hypothetical protein